MTETIKFVPFSTAVESAFWVRYCRAKLETIRLSESYIPITPEFAIAAPPRLQCSDHSLQQLEGAASINNNNNECVRVSGSLKGFNTLESFQKIDKNELLRDFFCSKFFSDDDENVIDSLIHSLLINFADLKSHKVVYWFAIPVLVPKQSIRCSNVMSAGMPDNALQELAARLDAMRRRSLSQSKASGLPPFFLYSESMKECLPLSKMNFESLKSVDDLVYGFFDPSPSTQDLTFGWPLRNLIAYLSVHLDLGGKDVRILSCRPEVVRRILENEEGVSSVNCSIDRSAVLTVRVPSKDDYKDDDGTYKVVGWELNARAKPGPRSVNLRPLLDPKHLAIQAADLNLKLMKWRMLPDLDVDMLQNTKVLLIGAGTLGCNVARVLLGWGIRKFTIIDYGKVSYSNPVRQSLFTLEDCHGSGKVKAEAASESLKTIAADVESEGIMLSIPMPGHPEDAESIQQSVETLDRHIQQADAVFLLTDTRESRWLPTVAAAAHNKVLINAALGLDSWLVMRHGGSPDTSNRHGCYFCNDVVAPENSTRNRTLDQQCTVTRPGLALIASSMAGEIMVSLLHHPDRLSAPAPLPSTKFSTTTADAGPLGVIPHQIRGSLVSYTMMTPSVPAFQYCTACSAGLVDAYRNDKVNLVQNVCSTPDGSYLEDLSGMTAYRAEEAEKLVDMEGWDDDED